ncbi:MAG: TIGR02996 domain-containing protein [Polyangiales bacterium]
MPRRRKVFTRWGNPEKVGDGLIGLDDLIHAIEDRPWDDGPRLVLADALTEAGDPQGELVSVQCLLADPARTPEELHTLRVREIELVARVSEHLRRQHGLSEEVLLSFERGFPVELVVYGPAVSEGIFMLRPRPRIRLELLDDAAAEKLANMPALAEAIALELRLQRRGGALETFARSPHLGALRALSLTEGSFRGPQLQVLADSASLAVLEHLELTGDREWSDDPSGALIALADRFPLRSLTLRQMHLGATDAVTSTRLADLLDTTSAHTLESLNFSGSFATNDALVRLPPGLRSLSIFGGEIDARGARVVAEHPGIVDLDLGANPIGDEGAAALTRAKSLRVLRLAHASLGDEAARAIVASNVEWVDLRGNELSAPAVAELRARFGYRVQLSQ